MQLIVTLAQCGTFIVFQTALHSQKKADDKQAQKAIASFVEVLGQKPYVTKTARELLWGYDNALLQLASTIAKAVPGTTQYPFEQFGLFIGVI